MCSRVIVILRKCERNWNRSWRKHRGFRDVGFSYGLSRRNSPSGPSIAEKEKGGERDRERERERERESARTIVRDVLGDIRAAAQVAGYFGAEKDLSSCFGGRKDARNGGRNLAHYGAS